MIKVFKVLDNTIYDCYHIDKYYLRMFKGTEEEFNKFYLEKVGHLPKKDYTVYDDPKDVARVKHGFCDGNAEYYRGKVSQINKLGKQRYAEKVYLASKFS